MSESRNDTTHWDNDDRTGPVGSLATQALATVASRSARLPELCHEDQVARLHAAVIHADARRVEQVTDTMLHEGIPPIFVSDVYVPAVAHVLGEAWCSDQSSFAEVTIGMSRLQTALRRLGPEWRPDYTTPSFADTVLVVVNADMYHTLGAILIAGQLRRAGVAAVLSIGEDPAHLSRTLAEGEHKAVLISSAIGEPLESVRKLVDIVRTAQPARRPVVLGGSILGSDADLRALTGVDHVTSDLDEAISLCGLKTPNFHGARRAPGV